MQDEIYDVIDEEGNVISQASWTKVHSEGLLHPSCSLFIFNNKERSQMLLQQRSMKMAQRPGAWQHACGGHIPTGLTPIEGLYREINEELFSGQGMPDALHPQFVLNYIQRNDVPGNNELLYLYQAVYEGPFSPDPKEVKEIAWIETQAVIVDMHQNPTKFTNSFAQMLQHYLAMHPL